VFCCLYCSVFTFGSHSLSSFLLSSLCLLSDPALVNQECEGKCTEEAKQQLTKELDDALNNVVERQRGQDDKVQLTPEQQSSMLLSLVVLVVAAFSTLLRF
jgi:hypothetical protein